jgi:hypothetical protein
MTTFRISQPAKKLFAINTESIENAQSSISLHAGNEEMLRVAPDGFYVRGVRIEQDADEARKVHDSFQAWLTWANLNQTR